MRRSVIALAGIAVAAFLPRSPASAQGGPTSNLTAEEKKVIGERLAPVVNFEKSLKISPGGTLFVVHTVEVPASRFRKSETDYEAFTQKGIAPAGVSVARRVDQHKLTKRGDTMEISFRYAISLDPKAASSGPIKLTLKLTERTGLANEVASIPVAHDLTVVPSKPTPRDMAADFRGYRVYKALATQGIKDLGPTGIRGLTLQETAELSGLDRVDAAGAERAFELDRWRRRMHIGRHHLEAAATSSDRATAASAQQYLALLDAPETNLSSLPPVSLVDEGGGAKASVEPVKPTEPAPKSEVQGGVLQPLDPAAPKKAEPDAFAARPEAPKTIVVPDPVPANPQPLVDNDGEDLSFARKSKDEIVPSYPRGLVLDDPNVGVGLWTRFSFAEVADRRTAITPAWFFGVQAPITNDLGIEITIPTVLVSITDIEAAVPVFSMGNPLLTAKYRIHLPAIGGRRPLLTPRVRWGVPINARNLIPRTQFGAEEFSFPAHFVDTYAFALEKSDVGGGLGITYMNDIVHGSAQLYVDYFIPVSDTKDRLEFTTLSYGLSFGVRPFGDIVGFYVEGRGTALVAGPRRSELFTYLGARGKFFDYFEPAVWISLPIGSVNRASSFQFGAELRVAYDFEGVITRGTARDREGLLENR